MRKRAGDCIATASACLRPPIAGGRGPARSRQSLLPFAQPHSGSPSLTPFSLPSPLAAARAPTTPPSASNGLGLIASPSQQGHSPAPTYNTLPSSNPPSPTQQQTPSYHGAGRSDAKQSPWVNQVAGGTINADDHLVRKDSSGQSSSDLNDNEKEFEEKTDKDAKEVEKTEEAFQQDIALEEAADLDMGAFTVKPKKLASLVDPKTLETLTSFGGIDGLLRGLGTDPKKGLDSDVLAKSGGGNVSDPTLASADARKKTYGSNVLPIRPPKSLFYLMYLAMKDKVLVRRPPPFSRLDLNDLLLTPPSSLLHRSSSVSPPPSRSPSVFTRPSAASPTTFTPSPRASTSRLPRSSGSRVSPLWSLSPSSSSSAQLTTGRRRSSSRSSTPRRTTGA